MPGCKVMILVLFCREISEKFLKPNKRNGEHPLSTADATRNPMAVTRRFLLMPPTCPAPLRPATQDE